MAEFKKSKYTQRVWHSPLILFVLFCVVLIFMYNMLDLVEKTRETSKKKNVVLGQINELHQRENALNNDIATLETETGMEEAIREKYQLVKAGEKMVVIVDASEAKEQTEIAKEDSRFMVFLKNIFR